MATLWMCGDTRPYKGTIRSLFQNAGEDGVVTLNIEDMTFFSNVVESAQKEGKIICEEVDGGFQLKLKALI